MNKPAFLRYFGKLAVIASAYLLLCSTPIHAQVQFTVYSGGYFDVRDYGGYVSPTDAHRFHIQLQGSSIYLPNWSIKARINGLISPRSGQQNHSGLPFPAEKISFRFTRDNGSTPTLGEINAPMTPIPFVTAGEVALIPSSRAPLQLQSANNMYHQINLYFEMAIAGGSYLDQLKNKQPYQIIVYAVPITFTLYDGSGIAIGQRDVLYEIQLNQQLNGNPGSEPTYGIEILGAAKDGKLDFNSLSSYLNGTSVTYPDAVKINSVTGFELTCKSLYTHLNNPTGDALPIDILRLQLLPGSNAAASYYPQIQLSTNPQIVLKSDQGKSTPVFMDIRYSAPGNDERLIQATSGKYSTVLVYQLVPR